MKTRFYEKFPKLAIAGLVILALFYIFLTIGCAMRSSWLGVIIGLFLTLVHVAGAVWSYQDYKRLKQLRSCVVPN